MPDKLKPLTLHAHPTGPNPYKIALEILSLLYEIWLWEFGDDPVKGVKGEAFLKINENGRVPAVEDPNTGIVSWKSGVAANYLIRNYDKGNVLGPRGASEQDRVDLEKWTLFLLTGLGLMMGQTNWYRHYNPAENEDALNRFTEQTWRHLGVLEGAAREESRSVDLTGWIPCCGCCGCAYISLD
jgi:glutathione S-transferase